MGIAIDYPPLAGHSREASGNYLHAMERPTALAGVKRPITDWEMGVLAKLKQKTAKANPKQMLAEVKMAQKEQRQRGARRNGIPDIVVHEEVKKRINK